MAEIREEPLSFLEDYPSVPIAFEVESILEVSPADDVLGGIVLREREQHPTFLKDYDAVSGNHPKDWAWRFDLPKWGLFSAHDAGGCAGCAAVFPETREVAVLYDLRVAPAARHRGIGGALFAAATKWAQSRGQHRLKVETQNINVPACRFYASQGCVLGRIDRFAYPELPDEVQLVWYKELA